MGIVVYPRAHASKPQQAFVPDGGHPLFQGLITGFLLNQGGFWRVRDVAQRFHFDHAAAFSFGYERFRWINTTDGPAYDSYSPSGGTLTPLYSDPTAFTVTDWSVSARIRLASGGTTGIQRIFSHQQASYWGLVVNNARLTALSSRDGITYPSGYGPDLRDDLWHRLDVVRDTSRGKFNFYVDGRLVQATTISDTGAFSNTGNPALFAYDIFSERFTGAISDLYIWRRARSHAEVQDLWLRPYAAYATRLAWSGNSAGGGGGGTGARSQAIICG